MEKLQYDSFYKFIVSLGIILIVSPTLAFYYLMSDEFTSIISTKKFNTLTETSQEIILKQSMLLKNLICIMPYILILFVFIGFTLIIYGSRKWHAIQLELDKQVTLDTQTKERHLKQMTPTEIINKACNEVLKENNETSPNEFHGNESLLKFLAIENFAFNYIKSKLPKTYKIKQNVRVGKYEYDIIAISAHDNIDLLYEIKHSPDANISPLLNKTLPRLKKSGVAYEHTTHKNFRMNLIVVSPQKHIDEINAICSKQMNTGDYPFMSYEIIPAEE